jgi:hypothetical protein
MTVGKIDTFHVEELMGEIELPCDYYEDGTPHTAGEWVLFLVRCGCGTGGTRLACDACAQSRIASDDAVFCACGEVTAPARLAYSYIEHVNKAYQ